MSEIKWNESLRLTRERNGYLQKELADKLNISERTLQRYEAGISEPSISILLELSKIYDTGIDVIVGNDIPSNFNVTKIEKHLKDIERSCHILRKEMYEAEDNNL